MAKPSTVLTLPPVNEMQQIMRSSGILDRRTIFPEHDAKGVQAQTKKSTITLANAQADIPIAAPEINFSWVKKYIPRLVGVVLTLQGLRGIYRSVNFILVEFPELEKMLAAHEITSSQINGFVSKAAITVATTVVSMVFALRLTILHTKAAKVVSTAIGIGLIIGNLFLSRYIEQQNTGVLFAENSANFVENVSQRVDRILRRE